MCGSRDAYEGLEATTAWWEASWEERELRCNGCGPEGNKVLAKLLPESILLMSILPACCIHDWDFAEGGTEVDRRIADERFYRNLLRLIRKRGGLLLPVRRVIAWWVFRGLRRAGGAFFGPSPALDEPSDTVG